MNHRALALFVVLATTSSTGCVQEPETIRVLIADGPQLAHSFEDTTPVLEQVLGSDPRFEVDRTRSSKEACEDGSYRPSFDAYDVVVINEGFGAPDWPVATREAFEAYMAGGGGMVSIHAANNCWPAWEEYNRMTAVGGWAGRDEKSGPYLYVDADGEVVRDPAAGTGGSHGPQHEFEVVVRDAEHPITAGLPARFPHGPDELYDRLRGPAENVTVLATAFSSEAEGGTGRHEPVLMAVTYGEGRVFHTVLGHDVSQIKEGSFVTTFLRGTEWAATGEVTVPVPSGFPNQPFQ